MVSPSLSSALMRFESSAALEGSSSISVNSAAACTVQRVCAANADQKTLSRVSMGDLRWPRTEARADHGRQGDVSKPWLTRGDFSRPPPQPGATQPDNPL